VDEFQFASFVKASLAGDVVYGWAIVCKEGGDEYVDLQGDCITEGEMQKAATAFMVNSRTGKVMHEGRQVATVLHSFPLTTDMLKQLGVLPDGVDPERTGWAIGMRVTDSDLLKRFETGGDLKGFSIGGKGKRYTSRAAMAAAEAS